ncbi:hypothetical protein MTO96_035127 [Rhipicephalus appendiculatus]
MPLRIRPRGLVRAMLLCFLGVLVLNAGPLAWAFNVDLPSALVHRGPEGSMFGFAVTVHRDRGFNCVFVGSKQCSKSDRVTFSSRTWFWLYSVGPRSAAKAHKAGPLRSTVSARRHPSIKARACGPERRHVLPIWAWPVDRASFVELEALSRGADRLRPRCLVSRAGRTLGPSGRGHLGERESGYRERLCTWQQDNGTRGENCPRGALLDGFRGLLLLNVFVEAIKKIMEVLWAVVVEQWEAGPSWKSEPSACRYLGLAGGSRPGSVFRPEVTCRRHRRRPRPPCCTASEVFPRVELRCTPSAAAGATLPSLFWLAHVPLVLPPRGFQAYFLSLSPSSRVSPPPNYAKKESREATTEIKTKAYGTRGKWHQGQPGVLLQAASPRPMAVVGVLSTVQRERAFYVLIDAPGRHHD